jgi:acyl-CoA reductase-like NAD-dependent aldehyde dehydrogenase
VLKPSELTPLSAGYLADAALTAGLAAGVLNVIPSGAAASEALVRHHGVDKISFTGSTATGRKIAESAAPTLKHVSLELGGKAAAFVLDDASVERLLETIVPAMLFNNGQMCVQPGRLVVPEHRKDEIVAAFTEAFSKVVIGLPDAPDTQLDPLISRGQYDHAMDLLRSAAEDPRQVRHRRRTPRRVRHRLLPRADHHHGSLPRLAGGARRDLRTGAGRPVLHR